MAAPRTPSGTRSGRSRRPKRSSWVEGNGTSGAARTTISALTPNINNESIFMIAGGRQHRFGRQPADHDQYDVAKATVRPCSTKANWSRTRSPTLKAPRRLAEPVATRTQPPGISKLLVTKFHSLGADVLNLPIRSYFRRYTDTASPIGRLGHG